MADISQIKLPDNNTYNFKDTVARGVKMYYGICTTAAATAAKVVTVGADQDFKLTVGALVMVKFTISNKASNVTINVNSTGAKSIYYNNAVYTSTSTIVCGYANSHLIYMYDGTNWVWVGHGVDNNTTYDTMSVAEGQTATATSARTMRSDYLKQIIQYHAVPSGQGVPAGGTAGQVLAKVDGTNYNTEWIDAPGGGEILEYTSTNFDSSLIPTSDPFCWYVKGENVNKASTSYTDYMPLLKDRISRSTTNFLSCYLFRKIPNGVIYALYVGRDYYTLFDKQSSRSFWTCITPIPGPAFNVSFSTTHNPNTTIISYSSTYRPAVYYDLNDTITENVSKIQRMKFDATLVFDDNHSSMKVPIVTTSEGSMFTFFTYHNSNYYRVVSRRTASNTWTPTGTIL